MKRFFFRIASLLPGTGSSRRGKAHYIYVLLFYSLFMLVMARVLVAHWRGPVTTGNLALALVTLLFLYALIVPIPFLLQKGTRSAARVASRLASDNTASLGFLIILIFIAMSLLGPFLAPYDPVYQPRSYDLAYQRPSVLHPMGTDRFGRDVLSRVVYGARVSMGIGVSAVLFAVVLGLLFGMVSGYLGGIIDEVLMRVVDGLLAFPRLLIIIILVAFFANSLTLLILLFGCTSWMGIARLVRAEILSLKERDFVSAVRASGAGGTRILWRHLLPNIMGAVIVAATLMVGRIILLESTLSFLGLGVQPPVPSWGNMVLEGREVLGTAWWVSAFPGMSIAILVVACNLVGDGLRDALERA